jgi:hypothetical protein
MDALINTFHHDRRFKMSEPKDMVVRLLRDMRDEIGAGFQAVDGRFDRVEDRQSKIDASQMSVRHAMTTDTLMSKFLLGDFDERLAALEQRLDTVAPPKA